MVHSSSASARGPHRHAGAATTEAAGCRRVMAAGARKVVAAGAHARL